MACRHSTVHLCELLINLVQVTQVAYYTFHSGLMPSIVNIDDHYWHMRLYCHMIKARIPTVGRREAPFGTNEKMNTLFFVEQVNGIVD